MGSFDLDSEWRRGVDEQLSYTVSVLRQALTRLDQPHQAVPPLTSPFREPESPCAHQTPAPPYVAVGGVHSLQPLTEDSPAQKMTTSMASDKEDN
jgi:hypothetical protein